MICWLNDDNIEKRGFNDKGVRFGKQIKIKLEN